MPRLAHSNLMLLAQKMARAFIKARGAAPPRPHPWAPQTGGILQKAAAAQANIHDKVHLVILCIIFSANEKS